MRPAPPLVCAASLKSRRSRKIRVLNGAGTVVGAAALAICCRSGEQRHSWPDGMSATRPGTSWSLAQSGPLQKLSTGAKSVPTPGTKKCTTRTIDVAPNPRCICSRSILHSPLRALLPASCGDACDEQRGGDVKRRAFVAEVAAEGDRLAAKGDRVGSRLAARRRRARSERTSRACSAGECSPLNRWSACRRRDDAGARGPRGRPASANASQCGRTGHGSQPGARVVWGLSRVSSRWWSLGSIPGRRGHRRRRVS
jgi:hypothetical protein